MAADKGLPPYKTSHGYLAYLHRLPLAPGFTFWSQGPIPKGDSTSRESDYLWLWDAPCQKMILCHVHLRNAHIAWVLEESNLVGLFNKRLRMSFTQYLALTRAPQKATA